MFCSMFLAVGDVLFNVFSCWWCSVQCFWLLVMFSSMFLAVGDVLFNVFGCWWCSVQCFWLLVMFCSMFFAVGDVQFNVFDCWWCSVQCFWLLVMFSSMFLAVGDVLFNVFGCWWCSVRCFWLLVMFSSMFWLLVMFCSMCLTVGDVLFDVFGCWWCSAQWFWLLMIFCSMCLAVGDVLFNVFPQLISVNLSPVLYYAGNISRNNLLRKFVSFQTNTSGGRMWLEYIIPISLLVLIYVDPVSSDRYSSKMKSNCSMKYVRLMVRHKNCIPVRIHARACRGSCASYTTVSAYNPTNLETKCDCCQYVGRKRKRFGMKCPHPTSKNHFKLAVVSMTMPKKCMCRPCSSTPNKVLSAEQSILRTSPILSDSLKATLRQIFLFFKWVKLKPLQLYLESYCDRELTSKMSWSEISEQTISTLYQTSISVASSMV